MKLRLLALVFPIAFAWPGGIALGAGDPILPLTEVHAGMDCIGETVIRGTEISAFNVHVIDVVRQTGEGPRILVRVSGPAVDASGIAQGFSGSPVYCTDSSGVSRNAGAIAESVGEYGNKVGLVTPIEQMLGESVKPPSSAPQLIVRARPLLGPLTVSGLSPWLVALMQRAGARAGRAVVSEPADSLPSYAPQPLVPGASVAAMYSQGSIGVGALGTVTYRDGANVYAFGHPLDGAGRRSLLLADAYVYYVVSDPNVALDTSYKLGSPGHTEGTLTSDTPNAVIGQVGVGPPMVPVHVAARDLDTGRALALRTEVADETDVGLPAGTSPVELLAPLSVAQAATQIFDGAPANQSGTMCFRIDIRESRAPLKFCNRYVGTGGVGSGNSLPPALGIAAAGDVMSAVGLLDSVQFAALHVTRVIANIEARRGLAQAAIVSAKAPLAVRPGAQISAALTVRVFRGGLRTISFPLRIPRNLHGAQVLTLNGPSSGASQQGGGSSSSLATGIAQSLTGTGGPSSPPTSITALRRAFEGLAHYDGLRVTFKPASHGRPSGSGRSSERAYRDPQLLITGRATLRLLVR